MGRSDADVLKNGIVAIDMSLPEEENQEFVEQKLDGIRASIKEIADEIDTISEESLEGWKEHCSDTLEGMTVL